jgi:UDP-GlcNAc:undecaprenyl-phosphate GlcNAc-1-phosphate transferase
VFIAPLAALIVTLIVTPGIRWLANRRKWLANPVGDRWHNIPTPLYGGVAMSMALLTAALISGLSPSLILGIGVVFVVGLADDTWKLPPIVRVIVELIAAILVLDSGLGGLEAWTPGYALAVLWIVLVSNAVNLIDGADGVAGSVVGATALLGGIFLAVNGNLALATLSFSLAAVCLGFLVYNWPPASIFMGDSGSLVLGYVLAIISLEAGNIASNGHIWIQYGVAFAFVAVPFMDASFVAMVRILVGQNPARGGTHHIHHRLRMSGFSARQTASLLAAMAALSAWSVVLAVAQPTLFGMVLLFGATSLLLLEALLVHHTGFLPSKDGETVEHRHLMRLGRLFKQVSPLPKVIADAVVVATSLAMALVLTDTGPATPVGVMYLIGLFVAVKTAIMWLFGLYKQQWLTSAGTPDLLRSLAAILAGSTVLTVIAVLTPYFSVGARFIVVDFMAASLGLVGLRIGYRAFRSVIGLQKRSGIRVLLYGAGQGGEFAVRELRLNPERKMNPVGFLDDDGAKHGAKVYGLTVFGDLSGLEHAVRKTCAEQVIICSSSLLPERSAQIFIACRELGLACTRMTFEFDGDISQENVLQHAAVTETITD